MRELKESHPFGKAKESWNLARLWEDLAAVKKEVVPHARRGLSKTERQDLCGLLCGYSPTEIAEQTFRQPGTLRVRFSQTLYRYVEALTARPKNSLKHWSYLRDWLEGAGYKLQLNRSNPPRVLTLPDYATPDLGNIYLAENVLKASQGSISSWFKFLPNIDRGNRVVLQTDDGRIALFVETNFVETSFAGSSAESVTDSGRVRIVARAGGNCNLTACDQGFEDKPEASILIDNNNGELWPQRVWGNSCSVTPLPDNEWHLISMTWQGYPEGYVQIYLDSKCMAEKAYNSNYNDGRPLFSLFSVGFSPSSWIGAAKQGDWGKVRRVPLPNEGSLASGGIQIRDLRLYRRPLVEPDFRQIMAVAS